MIKYWTNCKTCQMSRGNQKFRDRIYKAFFRQDETDERIPHIADEVGIPDKSIYNHMKKHVPIRKVVTPLKVERAVEEMKAKIAKETELAFDHDTAVPKEDYERVIDGVLAEGMHQMKNQGKTITISQLLTAAKIKADYQAKKRGQDIEVIKSMYRFTSGQKKDQDLKVSNSPPLEAL